MRILIIEDDPKCLHLMTQALKRQTFTVDQVDDGLVGFRKSRTQKYDLIILDLMLPGKSGFEIISSLRSINNTTPIMIVSGRDMIGDRVLGLNLGADDYLVKGFDVREFLARTKSLLRRRGHSGRNLLRHKDLTINFSSMQARRENHEIHLSRKEMAILIHLVRHKNHIVTRQSLMDEVWGSSLKDIHANTIDVHMKALRTKLDRPFETKLLRTVRGFGYIMED